MCPGRGDLEAAHWSDTLIGLERPHEPGDIGQVEGALIAEVVGPVGDRLLSKRHKVLGQEPAQLWTKRACRDLVLGRGGLDGHDNLALDLDHATQRALSEVGVEAPHGLLVGAVAYDQRGVSREQQRRLDRGLATYDEGNAALPQGRPNLGQPFQQEGPVPCVRLGYAFGDAVANQYRQPEAVGFRNRVFQGVIIPGALRQAHPVQHVGGAFPGGSVVQHLEAGRLDHAGRGSP
jgi:hypothetical protein